MELIVGEPVQVHGVEVIAAGSAARATVVKTRKSSPAGKPGELVIAMQNVTAIDGTRIPLRLLKKPLPRLGPEAADIGEDILIGIAAALLIIYSPNYADLGSTQKKNGKRPGRPAIVGAGEDFLVFVNGETAVKVKIRAETSTKDQQ